MFNRKPLTIRCAPNAASTDVVIAKACPLSSTAERCEVEMRSGERSGAMARSAPCGVPGRARFMLYSPISAARLAR
ncbi:hypothetical protein D3C80_1936390 [compost metagenome]